MDQEPHNLVSEASAINRLASIYDNPFKVRWFVLVFIWLSIFANHYFYDFLIKW